MNIQSKASNPVKTVFEDPGLAELVFKEYGKGRSQKVYSLKECQRALVELYKVCTLEARRAHAMNMYGLYNIDAITLREGVLSIAREGLSLLPASRHFYFGVQVPDFANVPQLYIGLKKRGIHWLIFNAPNFEDFKLEMVHFDDVFVWKGQDEKPIYEVSPENMEKPIRCVWAGYKEVGKPMKYFLIDGRPIEIKREEQVALNPSLDNPWIRFERVTKEAEALRAVFSALNSIYLFSSDSSMGSESLVAVNKPSGEDDVGELIASSAGNWSDPD